MIGTIFSLRSPEDHVYTLWPAFQRETTSNCVSVGLRSRCSFVLGLLRLDSSDKQVDSFTETALSYTTKKRATDNALVTKQTKQNERNSSRTDYYLPSSSLATQVYLFFVSSIVLSSFETSDTGYRVVIAFNQALAKTRSKSRLLVSVLHTKDRPPS